MRKVLTIVLLLLLSFSLISCGNDPKPDNDQNDPTHENNGGSGGAGLDEEIFE